MKKALLLIGILLLSVISTACINNLAVQELSNKANEYMQKGEYQEAVERLKASIDLDPQIFETRYNLAIAYTKLDDYANATEQFEKAIEINPENAESYYSLAVAQGNLIVDLKSGKVKLNEDGSLYKDDNDEDSDEETEYKPSDEVKKLVSELKSNVIANYETYLKKMPDAQDRETVLNKIKEFEQED